MFIPAQLVRPNVKVPKWHLKELIATSNPPTYTHTHIHTHTLIVPVYFNETLTIQLGWDKSSCEL